MVLMSKESSSVLASVGLIKFSIRLVHVLKSKFIALSYVRVGSLSFHLQYSRVFLVPSISSLTVSRQKIRQLICFVL